MASSEITIKIENIKEIADVGVAIANISKLASRKERGVIGGSGDSR